MSAGSKTAKANLPARSKVHGAEDSQPFCRASRNLSTATFARLTAYRERSRESSHIRMRTVIERTIPEYLSPGRPLIAIHTCVVDAVASGANDVRAAALMRQELRGRSASDPVRRGRHNVMHQKLSEAPRQLEALTTPGHRGRSSRRRNVCRSTDRSMTSPCVGFRPSWTMK